MAEDPPQKAATLSPFAAVTDAFNEAVQFPRSNDVRKFAAYLGAMSTAAEIDLYGAVFFATIDYGQASDSQAMYLREAIQGPWTEQFRRLVDKDRNGASNIISLIKFLQQKHNYGNLLAIAEAEFAIVSRGGPAASGSPQNIEPSA